MKHQLGSLRKRASDYFGVSNIQSISVPAQIFLVFFLGSGSAFDVGALEDKVHATIPAHLPQVEQASLLWSEEKRIFADALQATFDLPHRNSMDFAGWILEAASQQQLDPLLLVGLIAAESSFRVSAVSPTGAVGPAQVNPTFWQKFCVAEDLRNPASNVECGAAVLGYLIQKTGDEADALRAYNVGYKSMRSGGYLRDRADIYVSRVYEFQRQLNETM